MKREHNEEEEEEQVGFKQRRLFRLREDFVSKIRAHVGAHYFVEIVKYLSIQDAYRLSKLGKKHYAQSLD
jgi:hypothetical protein